MTLRREKMKQLMKQGRAEHIADLHNDGKCGLHRTIAQAHMGYTQVIRKEMVTRAARENNIITHTGKAAALSRLLGQEVHHRRGKARGAYNSIKAPADGAAAGLQPHPPASPAPAPSAVDYDEAAAGSEGCAGMPSPSPGAGVPAGRAKTLEVSDCLADLPRRLPQPVRPPPSAPLQRSLLSNVTPYAALIEHPGMPQASEARPSRAQSMSFYIPPKVRRPCVSGTKVLHSLPGLGFH